ncbi:hypothetical protein BJ983_000165 [Actinomycetospora corticicola]|uniref:Uncharacterized protein n=1 Tax=Actinomycetospora corticicola TaxID=663602 RepID=A0A7Y9DR95_9PSEU|nr:hypothetical protein [Actinomycetospora corticicola]
MRTDARFPTIEDMLLTHRRHEDLMRLDAATCR